MEYPEFFNQVPSIKLFDPLAHFLGTSNDGLIEYNYIDVVRLAGHSCPTVATAYSMTRAALKGLYLNSTPRRGNIFVEFSKHANEGTTGVVARIVSMLTGATDGTGFKGICGKFDRRYLIFFNAQFDGELRFTRIDSGDAIITSSNGGSLLNDDGVGELLSQCDTEIIDPIMRKTVSKRIQQRVRSILIDHIDDPAFITTTRVHGNNYARSS